MNDRSSIIPTDHESWLDGSLALPYTMWPTEVIQLWITVLPWPRRTGYDIIFQTTIIRRSHFWSIAMILPSQLYNSSPHTLREICTISPMIMRRLIPAWIWLGWGMTYQFQIFFSFLFWKRRCQPGTVLVYAVGAQIRHQEIKRDIKKSCSALSKADDRSTDRISSKQRIWSGLQYPPGEDYAQWGRCDGCWIEWRGREI